MRAGYEKAVKKLLTQEKRAATLLANAKLPCEVEKARALKIWCKRNRKTLSILGAI